MSYKVPTSTNFMTYQDVNEICQKDEKWSEELKSLIKSTSHSLEPQRPNVKRISVAPVSLSNPHMQILETNARQVHP